MPPAKQQPKTYILSFKTHKLTAVTCVPQADKVTIGDLKKEVLSVLQADVLRKSGDEDVNMDLGLVPDLDPNREWEIPTVESVDDFELSRAIKERGRPTGQYEVLSTKETVKQSLMNWESLFIQFRDQNGELLPVKVSIPSLADDDEEDVPATSKGKRKARVEDEEEISTTSKGKRKALPDHLFD